MPEFFDVINEKNEVIGKEERKKVHSSGLWHRGVHVGVFNSRGEIFLTKRRADKDVFPNCWEDMGEHVKEGESFECAAIRGLEEELDIKGAKVIELGVIRTEFIKENIKDREISKVFKCVYDGEIEIDLHEIADGKFFKIEDAGKMLEKNPENFTEWLQKTFKLYSK